jgi:SdrD B-like domain/FG-GAP-like repeat/Right handed beta helix region
MLPSNWLPARFRKPKTVRRPNARLQLERLESRITPSTRFVDNPGDFIVTNDQGTVGVLDSGDTVTWNPGSGSQHGGPVAGLTFGTDAFSTIQSAVNAASAGDTIRVAGGTFSESVNVNKSLSLLGNQVGSDARTRSGVPETVVGSAGGAFQVSANNITIDGFTISGVTGGLNAGVYTNSSIAGYQLLDNIITNNVIGLYANSNGAALVQHNLFDANNNPGPAGGAGIYSEKTDGLTIDSNEFRNHTTNSAVTFGALGLISHTNLTFTNNFIHDNSHGVFALAISGGLFQGNTLTTGGTGNALTFGGADTNIDVLRNDLSGNLRGLRIADFGFLGVAPNSNIRAHYNSFASNSVFGAGIADVGTGPGYTGTLDLTANWWGDVTGPTSAANPGGSGTALQNDFANSISFQPWLLYNDADPLQVGFQIPTTFTVNAQTAGFTSTNNNYRRLVNAIDPLVNGQMVILGGIFDWTEANAAASWALGNDGVVSAADDYSLLVRPNVNNVTITAASLGSARIQGPGDLPNADLEGTFVFNGGDNQNWTISNLEIFDFDLGMGFFGGAGGADAFDNTHILNNHIRVPKDLNASVAPIDASQNIGIHFSFGRNQTIQGNTIDIHGTGVSDSTNLHFSSSVGMQSNTSGSNIYDGLLIDGNTINVLGAQFPDPARILGIWENADGHTSNITVSNNHFVNLDPGNNPALNRQSAFRVTSHSSATTTVQYTGNTVDGANIGFEWFSPTNFAGNQPVRLIGNTLTNTNTGVLIQSNGLALLSDNTLSNSGAMAGVGTGVQVTAGSIATIDDSTNDNDIVGFATGIRVQGSATITGNDNSIHGNAIGIAVNGGSATISNDHIYNNSTGVRVTSGGAASISGNNFDGGPGPDNGTDLLITASAGAVTFGPGNSFAGDTFFIDNQSTQSFNLAGLGTSFDETNDFRIEDKIHHRVDTDLPLSTGLVTWVPNNLYVTTPGLGSTDSTIQRGVDAASAGDTVNVEAGTYAESVTVGKPLTILGAQSGVNPAAGRIAGGPNESLVQATGGAAFRISAPSVTVRGFSVTAGAGAVHGIAETTPLGGTTVRENFVYGFTGSLGVALAAGSFGFQITDNDIFNNYAGVYLSNGAFGGLVSGNFIHDHTGSIGPDQGSGVVMEGMNPNNIITQNTIDGNRFGVYVWTGFGSNLSGTTVFGNAITNSLAAGVNNTNAALLDASGNWWGTNTPAGVAAQAGVNVDYTPWLDIGIDSDPTTRFVGSFDVLHVDDNSPQTGLLGRIDEGIGLATGTTPTVIVEAGTYAENVLANKDNLLLRGATGTAGDVVIDPVLGDGITVTGDNITIRDLRVTGAEIGIFADGNVDAVAGLTLTNLRMDVNTDDGLFLDTITGIVTLTDLAVLNNADTALDARNMDTLVIQGGSYSNNHFGIAVFRTTTTLISNVQAVNNTVDGVNLLQSGVATLTNVTSTGNPFTGLFVTALDTLLVDGGTYNGNGRGFDLDEVGTAVFTDVTANGNVIAGLSTLGVTTLVVDGGSYSGNGGNGLDLANQFTTATISGATVVNNIGGGLVVSDFGGPGETLNLSDLTITGNGSGGEIDSVATVNFTGTTGDVTDFITASGTSLQHTRDPLGTNVVNQTLALANITDLRLFGDDGADTFDITPSPDTSFHIFGGPPDATTPAGDLLHVNLAGTTNAILFATPSPNGFSGEWHFGNRQSVFFIDIETLTPAVFISGQKFNDLNGDGTKDAGEPGLAGWTIFLDGSNGGTVNGVLDPGEFNTTTDIDGNYGFAVAPGTYTVREVQQAGWTQTTTNPADITSTGGTFSTPDAVTDVDFGNFKLITISGQKFNDLDGDGIQEPGDLGIDGVTIQLDKDANGTVDDTTTTSGGGFYSFTDLGPGTYRIREVAPAGTVQTTADPADIVLSSGADVSGVDFGNFTLITIGGQKFNDLDNDGVKDPGEPGLAGWTIQLDKDANGTVDGTTTTDSSGSYSFTNLGPGTYRIREVVQLGFTQTTTDPADIVASSGTNVSDIDFGNFNQPPTATFNNSGAVNEGSQGLVFFTGVSDLNPAQSAAGFHFAYDFNNDGIFEIGDGTYAGSPAITTVVVPAAFLADGPATRVVHGRVIDNLDGHGDFTTTITINNVAPTATLVGGGQVPAGSTRTFSFVNAHDPSAVDLATLHYSFALSPAGLATTYAAARAVPSASFQFTQVGTFTVFARVFDKDGGFTDQSTQVQVTPHLVAVGADAGALPIVRVFNTAGQPVRTFLAFPANFRTGVRVAVGDINGDGTPDIIATPGAGSLPIVAVYDGATGGLLRAFLALPPTFKQGLFVAAGDVNGDGKAEIITGLGPNGPPIVMAFDGASGAPVTAFLAFPPSLRGGVTVGAGDLNGDGKAEIIAGTTSKMALVAAFNGSGARVATFFAVPRPFKNGVTVAAGDLNGDGKAEVVVGTQTGGVEVIGVFSAGGTLLGAHPLSSPIVRRSVNATADQLLPRVAVGDVNNDGHADIFVTHGPGRLSEVLAFQGQTFALLQDLNAFGVPLFGGVYVGAV